MKKHLYFMRGGGGGASRGHSVASGGSHGGGSDGERRERVVRLTAVDLMKPKLKQRKFLGLDVSLRPTDVDPMVVSW
jgi:hypothetical protein